jgi:hypothetical protein
LRFLLKQNIAPIQKKGLTKLQGLKYISQYRQKNKIKLMANALSRKVATKK